MATDYRRSHMQPEKGRSYHAAFAELPHRKMVWQLEQGVLDRILCKYFGKPPVRYLDFACGTGRILMYLEGRTQYAVGVDVSRSMLQEARRLRRRADLIEADITKDDVLGRTKFDLITAFRFFANAQLELRDQAMGVLCSHLEDGGYLVFNNHMNTGSTRARLARLRGRGGYSGFSLADVEALVNKAGLEVTDVYHMCVLPASEEHLPLPVYLLRPLETLLGRFGLLRSFSENLVFVCRKVGARGEAAGQPAAGSDIVMRHATAHR